MTEKRRNADALRLLGLARRAGAVAAGTERARHALRAGKARLILVASDASSVQLAKIAGLVRRGAIPRVVLADRATLGAAVGQPPLSAVAVTDARLAENLLRRIMPAGPKT